MLESRVRLSLLAMIILDKAHCSRFPDVKKGFTEFNRGNGAGAFDGNTSSGEDGCLQQRVRNKQTPLPSFRASGVPRNDRHTFLCLDHSAVSFALPSYELSTAMTLSPYIHISFDHCETLTNMKMWYICDRSNRIVLHITEYKVKTTWVETEIWKVLMFPILMTRSV